jgi:hypothetical protein
MDFLGNTAELSNPGPGSTQPSENVKLRFLNQDVLRHQYPAVFFFVQHLAYNRVIKAAWEGRTHPSPFWASAVDGHLKLATVAWCKVFGTRGEEIHRHKTPIGTTKQQAQQDFRERIASHTGFTRQQWENYHKDMLDFRNKYVAHFDDQHLDCLHSDERPGHC